MKRLLLVGLVVLAVISHTACSGTVWTGDGVYTCYFDDNPPHAFLGCDRADVW